MRGINLPEQGLKRANIGRSELAHRPVLTGCNRLSGSISGDLTIELPTVDGGLLARGLAFFQPIVYFFETTPYLLPITAFIQGEVYSCTEYIPRSGW